MRFNMLVLIAVAFGSSSLTNIAKAQQSRLQAQSDPANKSFTVVATDGTVVTANSSTGRFYFKTKEGVLTELTFDQVLAEAEMDPAKRAELKQRFEAALADEKMANYTYVDPATAPYEGSDPCDGTSLVCCDYLGSEPQEGQKSEPQCLIRGGGLDKQAKSTMSTTIPITDLQGVTVVGHRPSMISGIPGLDFIGGSFWSVEREPYENPHPIVSEEAKEYQQCWAEDYNDFKESRGQACEQAKLDGVDTALSFVEMGFACKLALATAGGKGTTALLCGIAIVRYLNDGWTYSNSQSQCLAEYKGPENC